MSYTLRTEKTWFQTMQELRETFTKWGIDDYQIQPEREPFIPKRGMVRTEKQEREARRVRVFFVQPDGEETTLEMDDQPTPRDNLRVLYLAIEDMRMIDKRGLKKVMRQAYGHLPAPQTDLAVMSPYEVLGVSTKVPLSVIEGIYRAKARAAHPDLNNGDDTEMKRLNIAIAAIRRERGGT